MFDCDTCKPTARLSQGPLRDADGNEHDAQPNEQPKAPRTSMNELFGSDDDE